MSILGTADNKYSDNKYDMDAVNNNGNITNEWLEIQIHRLY